MATFLIGSYLVGESLLPKPETKNLWFYSGLFMVVFSMLFIEPFYSSPKNVLTNSISLLLVITPIKQDIKYFEFWFTAIIFLSLLVITSILTIILSDGNFSEDNIKNRISNKLKSVLIIIGQGRVLYSLVFIYFIFENFCNQNSYTVFLLVFWSFIVLFTPKTLHNAFIFNKKDSENNSVGKILGYQSRNVVLVKLYSDVKQIKQFKFVKYRVNDPVYANEILIGVVFEIYNVSGENYCKVICLKVIPENAKELKLSELYVVKEETLLQKLKSDNDLKRFLGIVSKNSTINSIRFYNIADNCAIEEGFLVELIIDSKRIFYQIINGKTIEEQIDSNNKKDYLEIEAVQLGYWDSTSLSFQKFGWVPNINTFVYLADTESLNNPVATENELKIGVIPNTSLPILLDINKAVNSHTAILGVTGTGKSYLARKLINIILQTHVVICVDFTGEWKNVLEENCDSYTDMETVYKNQNKIQLIQLDDISNTSEILKETNKKLQEIFNFARTNELQKNICLILEEAHTIIPEASFLGEYGNYSENKALINKTSQIALQGRKYGVGILLLAQRTANVSKTILTQCNTVICFQAFDETSIGFLKNYFGSELIAMLPSLKRYNALVTGKGLRSNIPLIVDLTDHTDDGP